MDDEMICDVCEEKKFKKTVFSGYWKWGDGCSYCQDCFDKESSERRLRGFKNHGIISWYNDEWIYRWLNPHGYRIFTEKEMVQINGSIYPSAEQYANAPPLSQEQKDLIDARLAPYEAKNIKPQPKSSREKKRKLVEEGAK